MPSNLPNRNINYLQLNNTKLLNSPLRVNIAGAFGSDPYWWKPVCKLTPSKSVYGRGGINLTGSLGGYFSDQIAHIDLAINNRSYGSTDSSPVRVVGTYKTRISTSGLSNDVPQHTIEVRQVGDDCIIYLKGQGHTAFNLRATVSQTYNATDFPEWLWDENSGVLLEEPEGEVIWNLIDDMSPTPDIDRVVNYITNPLDDNYAQQWLPYYSEAPEQNIDLNDYHAPGIYKSRGYRNTTQYIDNLPTNFPHVGFIMWVVNERGVWAGTPTAYTGAHATQYISTMTNTWARRFVPTEEAGEGNEYWTDWVRVDVGSIQAGTNITKTIDAQGRVVLSSTGGSTYTAGTGIDITNNVISSTIDTSQFATTTALNNGLATKQDTLTAGNHITIAQDGTISATGMTKQEILTELGYTEIEISKTDSNNNTTTVWVLGRDS